MDVAAIAAWTGAGLGIIGIATALWRLARTMWRFLRRIIDFLDGWNGRPARPGHAAEPGALERLANVETAVQRNTEQVTLINRRIALVEGELKPNGGKSFRDRVEKAIPPDSAE